MVLSGVNVMRILYKNLVYHVETSYLAHRTKKELRDNAIDAIVAMFLENRSKRNENATDKTT